MSITETPDKGTEQLTAPHSFSEMFMAIFRGEDPGGVLWQPRLEFWYAVNKKRGTLPEPLRDAELFDVYDYCHASVRYYKGGTLKHQYKNVTVSEKWKDEKRIRHTWQTPVGTLRKSRCG